MREYWRWYQGLRRTVYARLEVTGQAVRNGRMTGPTIIRRERIGGDRDRDRARMRRGGRSSVRGASSRVHRYSWSRKGRRKWGWRRAFSGDRRASSITDGFSFGHY